MNYLFNKLNIKNKMFCCRIYESDDYDNFEEEEHMHCFLLYYLNNKVYHIEHPNIKKKGIYEYECEKSAIQAIVKYYKELRDGMAPKGSGTKVPDPFNTKKMKLRLLLNHLLSNERCFLLFYNRFLMIQLRLIYVLLSTLR